MNPRAQELLVQWIILVMKMIVSRAEIFSRADREELATLTMQLDQEIYRAQRGQTVPSCAAGHHLGPFTRSPEGHTICEACGTDLTDWGIKHPRGA
jgi:hypothetical protein